MALLSFVVVRAAENAPTKSRIYSSAKKLTQLSFTNTKKVRVFTLRESKKEKKKGKSTLACDQVPLV